MATLSVLTFPEKVVLPFSTLVPAMTGYAIHFLWRRDKRRRQEQQLQGGGGGGIPGEDEVVVYPPLHGGGQTSDKMAVLAVSSSAILVAQAIFHVFKNLAGSASPADPRWGQAAFAIALAVMMCASIKWEDLRVNDDDILLDGNGDVAATLVVPNDALAEVAVDVNNAQINLRRRRLAAMLTYTVLAFQSVFDGLVLKYNPNAQDSGVQVAMFFVQKMLETVVIGSALVHACISTRAYVIYMALFTLSAGASTLAAYELVPPSVPIVAYENQFFQLVLGASGGVLMFLAFYFWYIEARRMRDETVYVRNPDLMITSFAIAFGLSTVTGFFG